MKISSPVEGFTGRTYLGPLTLDFNDGAADYDGDLSDGARAYLEASGYGVGGPATTSGEETPEPADPRDVGTVQVGTPLRDAAVDPAEGDFLAPTNAGVENPHGSKVVSPGIHALESLPVTPGPVPDEPGAQDAKETALARAVLVDREDVGDATQAAAPTGDGEDEKPKGNASREAWVEYATAHGATDEDLEGKSRDEIRDQFS